MPYFVTNESPDCSAWAVVKEDGELIACHDTEEEAISQMVAISLSEELEPGGTYSGSFRASRKNSTSETSSVGNRPAVKPKAESSKLKETGKSTSPDQALQSKESPTIPPRLSESTAKAKKVGKKQKP